MFRGTFRLCIFLLFTSNTSQCNQCRWANSKLHIVARHLNGFIKVPRGMLTLMLPFKWHWRINKSWLAMNLSLSRCSRSPSVGLGRTPRCMLNKLNRVHHVNRMKVTRAIRKINAQIGLENESTCVWGAQSSEAQFAHLLCSRFPTRWRAQPNDAAQIIYVRTFFSLHHCA